MATKRQSTSEATEGDLSNTKRRRWARKDFKPFVRNGDDASSDLHLYARCRLIDFKAIFALDANKLTLDGVAVFDLSLTPTMAQSSCKFCKIFAAMAFPWDNDVLQQNKILEPPFHIRACSGIKFWSIAARKKRLKDDGSIVLGMCNGPLRKATARWDRRDLMGRGVIQPLDPIWPMSSIEGKFRPSSPVQTFPKERLLKLLEHCRQDHCRCSRLKMRFPRGARVINCVSREIVPLNQGWQYLALSYVWGPSSSHPEESDPQMACQSTQLPAALPQTIDDAVQIATVLGFRYLWIDRYCIQQFHAADKKHQISQMANIYSCAVATICALGPDDKAGISGVSQPLESPLQAEAQGMRFVSTGRAIRYFLNKSAWTERGWTFQEAVLSTRCLIFTSEGVVMACHSGTFCENAVASVPSHAVEDEYHRESFLFEQYPSLTKNTSDTEKFQVHRGEYSRRKLGYDADALNAFHGILSQMDVPSYWGIPLCNTSAEVLSKFRRTSNEMAHISFANGLRWETRNPKSSTRRRADELPSWSWVSQAGAVHDAHGGSYLKWYLMRGSWLSNQIWSVKACSNTYLSMDRVQLCRCNLNIWMSDL